MILSHAKYMKKENRKERKYIKWQNNQGVGDLEFYFYNVNVTYSKIAICVILNPKITIFSLYWALACGSPLNQLIFALLTLLNQNIFALLTFINLPMRIIHDLHSGTRDTSRIVEIITSFAWRHLRGEGFPGSVETLYPPYILYC